MDWGLHIWSLESPTGCLKGAGFTFALLVCGCPCVRLNWIHLVDSVQAPKCEHKKGVSHHTPALSKGFQGHGTFNWMQCDQDCMVSRFHDLVLDPSGGREPQVTLGATHFPHQKIPIEIQLN